jgi:hypothetical protein
MRSDFELRPGLPEGSTHVEHYLLYLVELPTHLPPHRALLDAIYLAQNRIPSWFSDLRNVLLKLEVPVLLPLCLPSRESITQLVQRV